MRKLGSNKMPVFMLVDRTNVSDEIFIFAAFINELEMELRRDFTSDDTATVKKDEGEKDVNVDKRDEREKDAKVEKRNEGEKDAMVEKRDEGEKDAKGDKSDERDAKAEKRDEGEKNVTVEKRDGGEKEKDVTVEKEKRDGGWKEKERNVTVEKQLDDMCDQKKRKKKFCQNCGIEREKGLLKCKSCKRVRYCDIVCQRADWHNEHSMFCRL